ncbi:MAG: OB-fold nucleic acid binding domain-containing protein, partial [Ruminococcus sp.]
PISEYDSYINITKSDKIGEIINSEQNEYRDQQPVRIVCIVSKVKNQITKNNQMMAFVQVEDRYGSIEVIVFPNVYSQFGMLLNQGNPVEIRGNISIREDEEPKVICREILKVTDKKNYSPNNAQIQKSETKKDNKSQKLYLRIDNLDTDKYMKAKRVLEIFDGNTPVVFYLTDTDKKLLAPKNMWVSLNKVMIKELKYQLGEENVVIS